MKQLFQGFRGPSDNSVVMLSVWIEMGGLVVQCSQGNGEPSECLDFYGHEQKKLKPEHQ